MQEPNNLTTTPVKESFARRRAKFSADTFRMSRTRPLDWNRTGDDAVQLRIAEPDLAVSMSVDKFEIFRFEMQQVADVMARHDFGDPMAET